MNDDEEYYNIQLELTDEMWQYYEKSAKIDLVEKNQNNNKEKILGVLSTLAILNGLERNEKLKEINYLIDSIFKSEKLLESDYLDSILYNITADSYDINNFIMKLGNKEFKVSDINSENIQKIINEKIENKTNRDRINDNKNEIKDNLIKNISLIGEVFTVAQLQNKINQIFKDNLDMTKRMFENEIHRCTDRAYSKWNNDNNIKKVMYVSRLEDNTCLECKDSHGKVFDIDDRSIIALPRHVRCKCFYAVIPNLRWNNDFGKVDFKNFKEWSDNND